MRAVSFCPWTRAQHVKLHARGISRLILKSAIVCVQSSIDFINYFLLIARCTLTTMTQIVSCALQWHFGRTRNQNAVCSKQSFVPGMRHASACKWKFVKGCRDLPCTLTPQRIWREYIFITRKFKFKLPKEGNILEDLTNRITCTIWIL